MGLGGSMQRSPGNLNHSFSRIPQMNNPRSRFNIPYEYKTTFNGGDLIPFYWEHVIPGDTLGGKFSFFARLLSPLKVPIMDNLYLSHFFFYVPYRILQANFVKMMGEQANPGDTIDYLAPAVVWSPGAGPTADTIFDYFGVLPGLTLSDSLSVNAYKFRAYSLIWDQFFRDENLQDSIFVGTGDGPDSPGAYGIKKRGKRHDYLTACLPFAQKGDPVVLPLGGTAPVTGTITYVPHTVSTNAMLTREAANDTVWTGGSGSPLFGATSTGDLTASTTGMYLDPNGRLKANTDMVANLSEVTLGTAINDFRQAVAMQQFLERMARGGSRYTEVIRSFFNVISPDARLQRPEFLGGGETRIQVNPVANTAGASGGEVQGNLAGFVTGHATTGFSRSFTEHGVIIGLVSVRADLTYQQGLDRHDSKFAREDYFWPTFAGLGEQEVLNQEIWLQGNQGGGGGSTDTDIFGYIPRFDEYRSKMSLVTGQFRSGYAQPLDMWHLAEDFGSLPVLGDTFIQDDTEDKLNRVLAVSSEDADQLLLDVYGQLSYTRPIPIFGVPGLTRL